MVHVFAATALSVMMTIPTDLQDDARAQARIISGVGHVQAGVRHFGEKDYKAAIVECNKALDDLDAAIAANSKYADAYLFKGQALSLRAHSDAFQNKKTIKPEDLADAMRAWKNAIEVGDNEAKARAYWHMGNAEAFFSDRKEQAKLYYARGLGLTKNTDLKAAIQKALKEAGE